MAFFTAIPTFFLNCERKWEWPGDSLQVAVDCHIFYSLVELWCCIYIYKWGVATLHLHVYLLAYNVLTSRAIPYFTNVQCKVYPFFSWQVIYLEIINILHNGVTFTVKSEYYCRW